MNQGIQPIKAVIFCLLVLAGCEQSQPGPQIGIPSIASFSPEEGVIGTQVTISGTNFSLVPGENSVQFNGKTAEVDSATSTQLIATVPDGAGTGKITVTVNGITASSAKDFLIAVKNGPWWTQKENLPVNNRTEAASFSAGGKGYFVTGLQGTPAGGTAPLDLWAYDPSNNTWTQKADFKGAPRRGAVGFAIAGKGYVGTGNAGSLDFLKDFWQYDPATNSWTKKKDIKGEVRTNAVGFSIGNRGYIATGENTKAHYLNDLWEYNPENDTWSQKANLPGAANTLTLAAGFSIDNKGYIGTGLQTGENNSNNYATKKFWEYDPAENKWTQKKDFDGENRTGAVGFSIGNKGYIGTGYGSGQVYLNDFWEYDPAKDAWAKKIDFNGEGRTDSFGFSIGSKGYLGGGRGSGGGDLNDFWEYTP